MRPKIIVIDDDPTGSQTVHGCLLLLRWDVETLRLGLRDGSPIFFVLANTRAMLEEQAIATTKEICSNLKIVLAEEKVEHYLIVSRSDSTLRGHFPAEIEAIASELGEFDACFFAPAFFEGGRITRAGMHYVVENQQEIPVHQTEFAKDPVFGFRSSFLPTFIEEKKQKIGLSKEIDCLNTTGSIENLSAYFQSLCHHQYVILDGEKQADFDRLMPDLLKSINHGKKFIFRSAASLLTSLADVGQQPIPAEQMFTYRRSPKPGIIIVGSHSQKTNVQLTELLKLESVKGIEVNVNKCQLEQDRPALRENILREIQAIYRAGYSTVIFSDRTVIQDVNPLINLQFGKNITDFLITIIQNLPSEIGFIISKGGNTTNAVLNQGLSLKKIHLLGQIFAGCCLVQTESQHPQFPSLPIVLFPGNVGDRHSLVTVYQRLQFL